MAATVTLFSEVAFVLFCHVNLIGKWQWQWLQVYVYQLWSGCKMFPYKVKLALSFLFLMKCIRVHVNLEFNLELSLHLSIHSKLEDKLSSIAIVILALEDKLPFMHTKLNHRILHRLAVMASERLLILQPHNWALRRDHGMMLYYNRYKFGIFMPWQKLQRISLWCGWINWLRLQEIWSGSARA